MTQPPLTVGQLYCSYEDFLRVLVDRFGPAYLRNPDGDLLRYVPLELERQGYRRHRPERQGQPASTGEQPPSPATMRPRLLPALLEGQPLTSVALAQATGYAEDIVRRWLWRNNGQLVQHHEGTWSALPGVTLTERPRPKPRHELVREYLQNNGPATTRVIADALGWTMAATTAAMAARRDIFTEHQNTGHGYVWALVPQDVPE